ncbi:unnamed protein product, partial [marine sediment metagenome]
KILQILHKAKLDGEVKNKAEEEKLALLRKPQGQEAEDSLTKVTKQNILRESSPPQQGNKNLHNGIFDAPAINPAMSNGKTG